MESNVLAYLREEQTIKGTFMKPSMMVHAYNPRTRKAERENCKPKTNL